MSLCANSVSSGPAHRLISLRSVLSHINVISRSVCRRRVSVLLIRTLENALGVPKDNILRHQKSGNIRCIVALTFLFATCFSGGHLFFALTASVYHNAAGNNFGDTIVSHFLRDKP